MRPIFSVKIMLPVERGQALASSRETGLHDAKWPIHAFGFFLLARFSFESSNSGTAGVKRVFYSE
jgi:hypothetical protein